MRDAIIYVAIIAAAVIGGHFLWTNPEYIDRPYPVADTTQLVHLKHLNLELQAQLTGSDAANRTLRLTSEDRQRALVFYKNLTDSLQGVVSDSERFGAAIPVVRGDSVFVVKDSAWWPVAGVNEIHRLDYHDTVSAAYTYFPVNRFSISLGMEPRHASYLFLPDTTIPAPKPIPIIYKTKVNWPVMGVGVGSGIILGAGAVDKNSFVEWVGLGGLGITAILGLFNAWGN